MRKVPASGTKRGGTTPSDLGFEKGPTEAAPAGAEASSGVTSMGPPRGSSNETPAGPGERSLAAGPPRTGPSAVPLITAWRSAAASPSAGPPAAAGAAASTAARLPGTVDASAAASTASVDGTTRGGAALGSAPRGWQTGWGLRASTSGSVEATGAGRAQRRPAGERREENVESPPTGERAAELPSPRGPASAGGSKGSGGAEASSAARAAVAEGKQLEEPNHGVLMFGSTPTGSGGECGNEDGGTSGEVGCGVCKPSSGLSGRGASASEVESFGIGEPKARSSNASEDATKSGTATQDAWRAEMEGEENRAGRAGGADEVERSSGPEAAASPASSVEGCLAPTASRTLLGCRVAGAPSALEEPSAGDESAAVPSVARAASGRTP